MDISADDSPSVDMKEFYFLLLHFLKGSPLPRTADALRDEIETQELFSHRVDPFNGETIALKYDDLLKDYTNLPPTHLVALLKQLLWYGRRRGTSPGFAPIPPPVLGMGSDNPGYLAHGAGRDASGGYFRTENMEEILEITPTASGTMCRNGSFSLVREAALSHSEPVKNSDESFEYDQLDIKKVGFPFNFSLFDSNSSDVPDHGLYLSSKEYLEDYPKKLNPPTSMVCSMYPVLETTGHRNIIYCLCFDKSGTRFFTGSDDQTIKVWSSRTGRLLKTFRGHVAAITDISVNFHNSLLASSSLDGKVRIWSLKEEGAPVAVINAHRGGVSSVSWSNKKEHTKITSGVLLISSADSTISIWKVYDPFILDVAKKSEFISIEPQEVAEVESAIRLRRFAVEIYTQNLYSQVDCTAWSAGCRFFACGVRYSGDVYLFECKTVKGNVAEGGDIQDDDNPLAEVYLFEESTKLRGHKKGVHALEFAHTGLSLLAFAKDRTCKIWFKREGGYWDSYPLLAKKSGTNDDSLVPAKFLDVAWSAEDSYILASSKNAPSVMVFDAKTLGMIWESSALQADDTHLRSVHVVKPHPSDERIFASGCYGGIAMIWDIEARASLCRIPFHSDMKVKITDMQFSFDASQLAIVGDDGRITLCSYRRSTAMNEAPKEQFFADDGNELIQDVYGNVIDANSQLPPHVLPPSPMVDYAGQLQAVQPDPSLHRSHLVIPLPFCGPEISSEHEYRQLLSGEYDKYRVPAAWDAKKHEQLLTTALQSKRDAVERKVSTRGVKRRRIIDSQSQEQVPLEVLDEVIGGDDFDEDPAVAEADEDPDFMSGESGEEEENEELSESSVLSSESDRDEIVYSQETGLGDEDEDDDILDNFERRESIRRARAEAPPRRRSARLNRQIDSDYDYLEETVRPTRRSARLQTRSILYDGSVTEEADNEVPDSDMQISASESGDAPGAVELVELMEEGDLDEMLHDYDEFMASGGSKVSGWLLGYKGLSEESLNDTYVPQIDDVVVVFPDEYASFLTEVGNIPSDMNSIFPSSNPFLAYDIAGSEYGIECKVLGLDYGFIGSLATLKTCLIVDMEFMSYLTPNSENIEGMRNFTLACCQTDTPDFIIPKWRYDHCTRRACAVGDKFGLITDGEEYTVEVQRITDIKEWEGVVIKWTEFDEFDDFKVCSWELIDRFRHESVDWGQWSGIPDAKRKRLLDGLKRVYNAKALDFEPLRRAVSFDMYPSYYSVVKCPVWLDLLYLRLKNNYYRSLNELLREVEQLVTNARAFNSADSIIVKAAVEFRTDLRGMINDIDRPVEDNADDDDDYDPQAGAEENIGESPSEDYHEDEDDEVY